MTLQCQRARFMGIHIPILVTTMGIQTPLLVTKPLNKHESPTLLCSSCASPFFLCLLRCSSSSFSSSWLETHSLIAPGVTLVQQTAPKLLSSSRNIKLGSRCLSPLSTNQNSAIKPRSSGVRPVGPVGQLPQRAHWCRNLRRPYGRTPRRPKLENPSSRCLSPLSTK